MQFFFVDGGQQRGPFSPAQLRAAGVRPDTLVWREGMTEWVRADSVSELAGLFQPGVPQGVMPPPPRAPAPTAYAPQQPWQPQPSAGQQQPIGYASATTYGDPSAAHGPPSDGLGVASMVLGILAVLAAVFTFCLVWLNLPLAILAIILGHVGRSSYRRTAGRPSGTAMTGLICGYLALAITAVIWIFIGTVVSTASTAAQQQQQLIQQRAQQAQQQIQKQMQKQIDEDFKRPQSETQPTE